MSYFQSRPTTKVVLPSDKKVWVEVYKSFTWKQEKLIGEAILKGTQQPDAILQNCISSWNLTDESGEVAPIDAEHLDLLERVDAIAIISAVNGLSVVDETPQAKKASSSESHKR